MPSSIRRIHERWRAAQSSRLWDVSAPPGIMRGKPAYSARISSVLLPSHGPIIREHVQVGTFEFPAQLRRTRKSEKIASMMIGTAKEMANRR